MSKYSNLWQVLGEALCKHHKSDNFKFADGDSSESTIRKKAYFLFILEVALFEYRKNEISIWFQQSPKETLHSLVYSKIGILPDQFDSLSDKAKFTVLLKLLSEIPLPETAQSYLKNLPEPSSSDNFEIDPFGGWTLGTGWPHLKQE